MIDICVQRGQTFHAEGSDNGCCDPETINSARAKQQNSSMIQDLNAFDELLCPYSLRFINFAN